MDRHSSNSRSFHYASKISRLHAQRIPVANARLEYLSKLALRYDEIELAAAVLETPSINDTLRKTLWLKIVRKLVQQDKGVEPASKFLGRSEPLCIRDPSPFFRDLVTIDDCKDEICATLENYPRQVDGLRKEMDRIASTARRIKDDTKAIDQRYAILEPGGKCRECRLTLFSMEQYFVFQ